MLLRLVHVLGNKKEKFEFTLVDVVGLHETIYNTLKSVEQYAVVISSIFSLVRKFFLPGIEQVFLCAI